MKVGMCPACVTVESVSGWTWPVMCSRHPSKELVFLRSAMACKGGSSCPMPYVQLCCQVPCRQLAPLVSYVPAMPGLLGLDTNAALAIMSACLTALPHWRCRPSQSGAVPSTSACLPCRQKPLMLPQIPVKMVHQIPGRTVPPRPALPNRASAPCQLLSGGRSTSAMATWICGWRKSSMQARDWW